MGNREISKRDKRVLQLRYGLADGHRWTLAEIGRELGISRERVRQLEVRALEALPGEAMTRDVLDVLTPTRPDRASPSLERRRTYWERQAEIGLDKGWLVIERGRYQTTDLGNRVAGGWLRLAMQGLYNGRNVDPELATTRARAILALRGLSDLSVVDAGSTGSGNYLQILTKVYATLTTEEREYLRIPTGLADKSSETAVLSGLALQPEAKGEAVRLATQLRYQERKERKTKTAHRNRR